MRQRAARRRKGNIKLLRQLLAKVKHERHLDGLELALVMVQKVEPIDRVGGDEQRAEAVARNATRP